ncbi:MAG: hypothetical protein Q7U54_02855 [Bacteroidales bacterium]|nr:hypothetical protein [Bacteroidales bacterium]
MNFGILCNGNTFQQWQFESIRILIDAGHNCTLLIVNDNLVEKQSFTEKLIHYPYSKILCRLWFRYLLKPEAKKRVNFNDFYRNIPEIKCLTRQKGYSEYFHKIDVDIIKSYNLDFMLRFGFDIIKGDILEAAKYGVWSYHHDDDHKYRGVPTGFWEILFADHVNAAILQRLTDKLDSGVILHKAYFATINHSWEANLNNLLQSSTEWPLQVCSKIENGNTEFLSVANSSESAIYKTPGNLKMIRFLLKVAINKLKFHYRDLFLSEKWNVGIISLPAEELVKQGNHTIPEPVWLSINKRKSVFHADPFGFVEGGSYHIICEEYDYKSPKGILTSYQVDRQTNQVEKKTVALEKNHHLAYPYLFEFENIHYCIPENSEGNSVDLYRYEIAEGKLVFDQTLIENLKAVDTSMFFHEGTWWLFFTDKKATNERLNIWYSENLRGPFKPHSNNPVKVDIRSSRPAGNPFILDGKLLRPAQDCSIRSGRRISINQVLKLTPNDFVEVEYATLNPALTSKFRDGMHTFCVAEGVIIVDGKSECFIWQAFMRKLIFKFKKLFKIKKW